MTASFYKKTGLCLIIVLAALALTGCTKKTSVSESANPTGDRTVANLTIQVRSVANRQPINDVTLLITETAVTTQRSLVSQTVTANSLGRAVVSLPVGRYLIQPLDRDQYVGGQAVDLRQATQVTLDLTPRQATNLNETR